MRRYTDDCVTWLLLFLKVALLLVTGSQAKLVHKADLLHDTNVSCLLSEEDKYIFNRITELLGYKTKLIHYNVTFANYTVNPLLEGMTSNFKMNEWSRVSNQHGQTLLSLAFNYGVLSLMTLTFGIAKINVVLIDQPNGCFGKLKEDEKINLIMQRMLRDFKTLEDIKNEQNKPIVAMKKWRISKHQDVKTYTSMYDIPIQLVGDERICHQIIADVDGYGRFKDRCCHRDRITGELGCSTDISNIWLTILYLLLKFIRFAMLFFGPIFFVANIEQLGEVLVPYVVKLKEPLYKTVVLARPTTPVNFKFKSVLDLKWVRKFPRFKEAVSDLPIGEILPIKISQYDILVDYKKLMTENTVPIGLMSSLSRTFFQCKIRKIGPFVKCCQANMFKTCKTFNEVTWISLWSNIGRLLMIILLPTPFYVRVLVYYKYEAFEVNQRKQAMIDLNLLERYENNFTHYLTPSHPMFICIYVTCALTAIMLAYVSHKGKKSMLKHIIVDSFADLRDFSCIKSLGFLVTNVVWPFQRYGIMGCVVCIVYWPIVIPISVLIYFLYCLPTVYVSFRMLSHAAMDIRTATLLQKRKKVSDDNVSGYRIRQVVDNSLRLFDIRAYFSDPSNIASVSTRSLNGSSATSAAARDYNSGGDGGRRRFRCGKIAQQLCIAVMCVLTLTASLILLTECIGFIVEIIVFTLMGIIVNAGSMLKYCTLLFLVVLYSFDTFNNVPKKYLKLNKALFSEVKCRIKNLNLVTSLPSYLQENFGFKSCENSEQAEYEEPDDLAVSGGGNIPIQRQWFINDLVLFVDNEDMPRIPRKLFEQVCEITVAGSPGPVYRGLIAAFEEFIRTVAFLLLVFIVILSFGTVYKVSSTNQTLATLAGGFLPFVLRTFMQPSKPDIEIGTVSFRNKLDEIIINFHQKWSMYDFPFEIGSPPEDENTENDDKKTEDKKKDTPKQDHKPPPTIVTNNRFGVIDKQIISSVVIHESLMDPIDSIDYIDSDAKGLQNKLKQLNDEHSISTRSSTSLSNVDKAMKRWCYRNQISRIKSEGSESISDHPEVDILIYLPEYSSENWLREWSDISEYDEPPSPIMHCNALVNNNNTRISRYNLANFDKINEKELMMRGVEVV